MHTKNAAHSYNKALRMMQTAWLSPMLCLLVAACGVADQPTQQVPQTEVTSNPLASASAADDLTPTFDAQYYLNHSELWPTHSPEMQTQAALIDLHDTAVANRDATSFALPTAAHYDPLPVYPMPTIAVGILPNCYSVDRIYQFAVWSCWQGQEGDTLVMVSAGGESGFVKRPDDPSKYQEQNITIHGGLLVCTTSLSDPNLGSCDPLYWRRETEGRLKIIAVSRPHITVEAASGSRYGFNIDTRQWEAPQAVLPTATPSPTNTPLPTNTPTALHTAITTPASAVINAVVRPALECVCAEANGRYMVKTRSTITSICVQLRSTAVAPACTPFAILVYD